MLTARSRRHADYVTRITDATQVKLRNSRHDPTCAYSATSRNIYRSAVNNRVVMWPNDVRDLVDIALAYDGQLHGLVGMAGEEPTNAHRAMCVLCERGRG